MYDSLTLADVAAHLQSTELRHDPPVAVAAFVCIGHLNAVCADVCRVLQPGGRVGFSVDQAKDTEDRQRWPSSRYAQSAHYPKSLPRGRGFTRPQQSRVPCATSNNSPWQSSRPTPAC